MNYFRGTVLALAVSLLCGANAFADRLSPYAELFPNVEVMAYNVENLFDATHDINPHTGEDKRDYAYMPKADPIRQAYCRTTTSSRDRRACEKIDWTQAHFEYKVQQIAKVLNSRPHSDIVGLVEVENKNALEALAHASGYAEYILEEGPDVRGIDVALMYKPSEYLQYVTHTLHEVKVPEGTRPTRSILEVQFKLYGYFDLFVYVNHWPSQGNPSSMRMLAAKRMRELMDRRQAPNTYAIALGDFNVIPSDYPHAINTVTLDSTAKMPLKDISKEFSRMARRDQRFREKKEKMPLGTYFYPPKMAWNKLDRIFVSENFFQEDGMKVDLFSYDIIAETFMTKLFEYTRDDYNLGSQIMGIPFRYITEANPLETPETGYSDHFPVVVTFGLNWFF